MTAPNLGRRTIDLRVLAGPDPASRELKRRVIGITGAAGFHVLILAALLWSPVGQLATLGKTAPGATWITLAPVATGVTAQDDDIERALLSDRPIYAEKLTTAMVEQNADASPVPEASPLLPQSADNKNLASPGLPSSGTFTTARLGEGGSNDPYAGAALPLRVAPVKPAPRIDDAAAGSHYEAPLRADTVAYVTSLLEKLLAEHRHSEAHLTSIARLRVRVTPDGVVIATQFLDPKPDVSGSSALAAILNGRQLFQAQPDRHEAYWQSLQFSLCRNECLDNDCGEPGVLGLLRIRVLVPQTGIESPACDGTPVQGREAL